MIDIYSCKVLSGESADLEREIVKWMQDTRDKVSIEHITQSSSENGTVVCVWYNVI